MEHDDVDDPNAAEVRGTPPNYCDQGAIAGMKRMIRKQVDQTIMSQPYPTLDNWHPLTVEQKFHSFVAHTYSPITFAGAAVDAINDKFSSANSRYAPGASGLAQHYGIELATSETDVFFERFLFPTILRQDPRYFRNPELPFFKRILYSVSRVVITRGDNGHDMFNGSKILGSGTSQALSDLYVPGQRQGLAPIRDRVSFDLLRDAGFNVLHEFWPDLRRKILHR